MGLDSYSAGDLLYLVVSFGSTHELHLFHFYTGTLVKSHRFLGQNVGLGDPFGLTHNLHRLNSLRFYLFLHPFLLRTLNWLLFSVFLFVFALVLAQLLKSCTLSQQNQLIRDTDGIFAFILTNELNEDINLLLSI